MPKQKGAGALLTASKGLQALEPKLWRNVAENFPKALEMLEKNLVSTESTPQERMQALKFYADIGIRLMKEHHGKEAKDFADKIEDKSGRKKQTKPVVKLLETKFTGTED